MYTPIIYIYDNICISLSLSLFMSCIGELQSIDILYTYIGCYRAIESFWPCQEWWLRLTVAETNLPQTESLLENGLSSWFSWLNSSSKPYSNLLVGCFSRFLSGDLAIFQLQPLLFKQGTNHALGRNASSRWWAKNCRRLACGHPVGPFLNSKHAVSRSKGGEPSKSSHHGVSATMSVLVRNPLGFRVEIPAMLITCSSFMDICGWFPPCFTKRWVSDRDVGRKTTRCRIFYDPCVASKIC